MYTNCISFSTSLGLIFSNKPNHTTAVKEILTYTIRPAVISPRGLNHVIKAEYWAMYL